jgi:Protein of unknown function (DUF3325)
MSSAIAFTLAYAGLTAVCLSMERHYRLVWGQTPSVAAATALRVLGFVVLCVSVVPAVSSWSAAIGVIAWFGFMTLAALPLIFLLPYAPRVAAGLAVIAPTVVALLALIRA